MGKELSSFYGIEFFLWERSSFYGKGVLFMGKEFFLWD